MFVLLGAPSRRSHQEVEGERHDEQQAERRVEGLVGGGRHEDVLVLVDADRVLADRGAVNVVPRDGTCRERTALGPR